MSSPQSERELLFARVHKQRMADSLSRNLSQLAQTEERLGSSRLSSASSSSLHSLRRANHRANSKEKMLKEIIEKLRDAKLRTSEREDSAAEKEEKPAEKESPGKSMRGSRASKLEEMMRDIKKCNQMSTKAVYSIKKNLNEQLTTPAQKPDTHRIPSVLLLVNEVSALKLELASLRQENRQLLTMVQQKDIECPHCKTSFHI